MKKLTPPPAHFPYQRQANVCSHFEQTPYVLNNAQAPMDLLEEVPSIKLEGDWLVEAGFKCKTEVVVTVKKGRLVIEGQK